MSEPTSDIRQETFSSPCSTTIDISAADHVLGKPSRAIYVGGGGNLIVRLVGDAANVTFVSVPAGTLLPIAVKTVVRTSTTATSLIALH